MHRFALSKQGFGKADAAINVSVLEGSACLVDLEIDRICLVAYDRIVALRLDLIAVLCKFWRRKDREVGKPSVG